MIKQNETRTESATKDRTPDAAGGYTGMSRPSSRCVHLVKHRNLSEKEDKRVL